MQKIFKYSKITHLCFKRFEIHQKYIIILKEIEVILLVLDWTFYLNLTCSLVGIVFFIYSSIIIKRIRELFPGTNIIKKWSRIQVLIILFLIGYVFNIIALFLELSELIMIMTAMVYIFGGFFVFYIINLSYKTYKLVVLDSKPKKEN